MPAQLDAAWSFGDALGGHLANGRRHQAKQMVDQMLAVVVIGVVIIVGILVYGEIESSLPAPDNSNLANTQDNTTNTFGDAMELAPVVLLVIIASLILSVVRRF
jgi:hypothetical protein